MFVILFVFVMCSFLVLFLFIINFVFSLFEVSSAKASSFDCGFSSVGGVQVSFSVHFLLIILVFVVFDLEVVLLLGFLLADLSAVVIFSFLFVLVIISFYLEWYFGKLVWLF